MRQKQQLVISICHHIIFWSNIKAHASHTYYLLRLDISSRGCWQLTVKNRFEWNCICYYWLSGLLINKLLGNQIQEHIANRSGNWIRLSFFNNVYIQKQIQNYVFCSIWCILTLTNMWKYGRNEEVSESSWNTVILIISTLIYHSTAVSQWLLLSNDMSELKVSRCQKYILYIQSCVALWSLLLINHW